MRQLPAPALTLLRRLDTHETARVVMRRIYPNEPRYRVVYEADKKDVGLRFLDGPTEADALAALAMTHCVRLITDKREGEEDVREWGITERGREVLGKGGVVVDAEPEPMPLFAPDVMRGATRNFGTDDYER